MKHVQQSIWENARSLLIFYVHESHEEFNVFRFSLEDVLNDSNVKRLKVIIQIKDPKDSVLKHSLFSYITDKDLALFGNKLKKKTLVDGSENLEIIRSSHFDLFMCFGTPSKKVQKWLTGINTTRRIAINSNDDPFFDMNLHSSIDSMENNVNFAIKMLNKII